MTLTDQQQASALADVKEGRSHVSSKNTAALVPLDRAITTLGGTTPPPPPPPPPPPSGVAIPGVTVPAAVRWQPKSIADVQRIWNNTINKGPWDRVSFPGTPSPYPLLGTTTPGQTPIRIDAHVGDESDGLRQQIGGGGGAGSPRPREGECWAIRHDLMVPTAHQSQVWELFGYDARDSGVPFCSSLSHEGADLHATARDSGGSNRKPLLGKVPDQKWVSFVHVILFSKDRNKARTRVWAELTGDPSAPYKSVYNSGPGYETICPQSSYAGMIVGVYTHSDTSGWAAYDNWEWLKADPAKAFA